MAQINKPSDYFNTITWTGDGSSSRGLTGVGFQPDWVWLKRRDAVANNNVYDVIRGATNYLLTDSTNAEATIANRLTSFDSDGFTVGNSGNTNISGGTYVGWNWLAGGTAVSNTDGSITSSVSANTTSGFSIVSYTGTGANATVGHGLGVAPAVVLVKNRTTSGYDWFMYHHKNTSEPATDYLRLNLTSATTDNVVVWNDTEPTSLVFSISTSVGVNANTDEYIAYCFAEKKGFSKFGSYTGNGSTDGTFVYTGFKPAWVMMKRTDTTNDWFIYDSTRNTFNETNLKISANTSGAESTQTTNQIDILSNGFKCRGNAGATNASGGTYIYMVFAENPLVGTNNIPATAR